MGFKMDDDRTIMKPRRAFAENADSDRTVLFLPDTLYVSQLDADGKLTATFSFAQDFTAGRALDNAIAIDNNMVSRHHLAVKRERDGWWVYNLQSANGVYIKERLIEDKEQLSFPVAISLGRCGISFVIQKPGQASSAPERNAGVVDGAKSQEVRYARSAGNHRNLSQEEIKARLLAEDEAEDAGDYTRMVRKMISDDRTIRKKSYKKVIWVLGAVLCLSVGLAAYQQVALSNARKLAIEMFYDIKTLEVSLSQADIKLEKSADALDETLKAISDERMKVAQEKIRAEQEEIANERRRMLQERTRLANMKAKYREYVKEAKSLRLRFPSAERYEEELIAKVAYELGESELELPDGFVTEVRRYIQYWQGSSRMQKAMENIEKNNYMPIVIAALKRHGLPLQFFYLPLQENNFDAAAIGPETRFGIAKGAWQLLPTTAQEYGIPAGPLANTTLYDEQDARFDFERATQAGVKYLRHIYSTEAQASGLLVMASYNYGDNRVRRMIKDMPDNPRERNFWKFIQHYELPKETHDYVFYIFSAAVIGEDPQHFGFRFTPPLFRAEAKGTGGQDLTSTVRTH